MAEQDPSHAIPDDDELSVDELEEVTGGVGDNTNCATTCNNNCSFGCGPKLDPDPVT